MNIIELIMRMVDRIRYGKSPDTSHLTQREIQTEINRLMAKIAEDQLKLGEDKIMTPPHNLLNAKLPKRKYKWRKKVK